MLLEGKDGLCPLFREGSTIFRSLKGWPFLGNVCPISFILDFSQWQVCRECRQQKAPRVESLVVRASVTQPFGVSFSKNTLLPAHGSETVFQGVSPFPYLPLGGLPG